MVDNNYSQILDVIKPNLFKGIFPYEKFPVSKFDNVTLPYDLPDDIWITDTTFRDGQQSMESFTVEQIEKIFKMLNILDNGNGLIRQSEFFMYSKRDREALEKCQALGFEFPEITGWARPKIEDMKLAKACGVKETGILMSCSDYHIFQKLNKSRSQVFSLYLSAIEKALEYGIKPRCHLEDITRADVFGFVVPLVTAINDMGKAAGVDIKFRICDTLGVGKPFNGHKLPRSVPGLVYYIKNLAGLKSEQLEWHGHNDYYYCTANSTAAWMYGASSVSTTLLGIGERTGNCPMESMLVEYHQLKEPKNKINFAMLNEIVAFFDEEFGFKVHTKMPFLGAESNSTRAGIHADGIMKNADIYNSFNSKDIFNRNIKIVVNQYSGVAGISGWINLYYDLARDVRISKKDSRISLIKNLIDAEYDSGRTTAISDKEMVRFTEQIFGNTLGNTGVNDDKKGVL
ncbi:Isopropylmalate/homocitrate/citramalate synthases [Dethiosulfatibacter aminovorans DSM 17477]|uniref:Isopropylmalate/homocitrate/citramalate synthases n=1 Tax=Dethiosulfatibacter aminovorans DSM 17477 TaxID=1121476 RepID=A0A1M6K4S7_9FIRM|nr:2-isopropylmalate synthase [Dethiosulfatibacter aminovorans]SHJ53949.1 Isopropylmalate/homocitrate/citramalate synthases [Dethiosulfatibacter aminovorans DSM 17477]